MICPQCGMENKDSAKFCKNCGSPLKSNSIANNGVQSTPSSSSMGINNQANNAGKGNKNLILICATIIICIAIIAAAFVMISGNDGGSSDSDADNNVDSNSNNAVSDSSSSSIKVSSSSASESTGSLASDIHIKYCDFYTGSAKTDKSYCSANIGTEHYGEKYKISVQYSRIDANLNDGVSATKTVDGEGFLHIYTSNAFDVYPDKAVVTIYDAKGNYLTSDTFYLETTSGQQKFGH